MQKATTNALAGLRVLVAEDHPVIRQVTCESLARIGMLPTAAEDGEIAVATAEASKFDLILMDLQMPRLDGDKAAVRIRSGSGPSAQARIICVTASPPPDIALKPEDFGFDACMPKPLDIGHLANFLQGTSLSASNPMPTDEFDSDTLKQLRDIDGGRLLLRTLKAFSADIEATRIELAVLIARHELVAAGRKVHKLVGLSDTLGASALSAELRKLENVIGEGDIEMLKPALKSADEIMRRTKALSDRLAQEGRNPLRHDQGQAATN
jgi:CheY-like chemotaxis protein